MLIIFFGIKGIVHKEFVVPHTTSTFYIDWVKMCEDFAPKFGDAVVLRQRTVFIKNNTTVVPHPPCFSLFPRSKIKLKSRQFDTTDVIEAESQMVLNTLTEHDFQHAFKKWQKPC
jgi:hypothetical protein